MTRVMPCSSPSSRRRCRWPGGRGSGSTTTVTRPSVDLDRVGPHVVGPGIERAAGGQVEAGVVPVAGDQPALDRAPMQREAHVRAAVVERVGLAVAPEDAHTMGTQLGQQLAIGLQRGQ